MMNTQKKGYVALLAGFLAAVAVLSVLVLVPASVPVLVDPEDPLTLVNFASPEVLTYVAENPYDYPYYYISPIMTGYSVCISVGTLLAISLTGLLDWLRNRDAAGGVLLAVISGAFALVCSHLLYFATRSSYIINDFADLGGSSSFVYEFWKGGYTMYGAILGGLLGATLYGLVRRQKLGEVFGLVVPGMLLLVIAGRLGEHFTGYCHGIGNERATEALAFLPFTKPDYYETPRLAVYMYEALAAVAAMAVCGVQQLLRQPAARTAENGLAIISAYQLLLESTRGDDLIKFGFVCLNMLLAAAVLVFIIVTRIVRHVRRRGWNAWQILRIVLLLAGAGLVIAIEFALDGKIQLPGVTNTMLYAVDFLAATAMMLSVVIGDGRVKEAK